MLDLTEPTNVLIFQVSVKRKIQILIWDSVLESILTFTCLPVYRLIRIALVMASLSVADREFFLFLSSQLTFLEVQLQLCKSPSFKVRQVK